MATQEVNEKLGDQDFVKKTYSSIMREIRHSAYELIESELQLLVAELKQVKKSMRYHARQVMFFGWLLAASIIPFLAFLVIGLGELLEGRYWLSSLIVSVVCALAGGPMAFRAWRKIENEDLQLPRTKAAFEKEMQAVRGQYSELKSTMKGDRYESN